MLILSVVSLLGGSAAVFVGGSVVIFTGESMLLWEIGSRLIPIKSSILPDGPGGGDEILKLVDGEDRGGGS